MKMKKLLAVAALALLPVVGFAAGGGFPLDDAGNDTSNKSSLQRGAQVFVNYCMGCHSANYQRYSRVAADLGVSEDLVRENLIFTTDKQGEPTKVGSLMENNMSKDYAKQVFGANPPNLALIARSRGTDWLYTYLRTFYQDESRPVGVNNMVFPSVGMPHVLWELEGAKKAVFKVEKGEDGIEHRTFEGFEQVTEGKLSTKEYDNLVRDLVNFLEYLGDPIKEERHRIGMWVMLFLFVFLIFAILLKKEYWRDIRK